MAVFQWIPDQDQIFDNSNGKSETLVSESFNKTENKTFTLDTTFTLTLLSSGKDIESTWDGDFFIKNGTLEIKIGAINIRNNIKITSQSQTTIETRNNDTTTNPYVDILVFSGSTCELDKNASISMNCDKLYYLGKNSHIIGKEDSLITIHANTIGAPDKDSIDTKLDFSIQGNSFMEFHSRDHNNNPFDLLNKEYQEGIFNFITKTGNTNSENKGSFIFKNYTQGQFGISAIFGKKLLAIDGVPVSDRSEFSIKYSNNELIISLK